MFDLSFYHHLLFSGSHTDANEFKEFLCEAYPKLRLGGGFELLKISGTTRSRHLILIPCPNEGYHVRHLKDPQAQIGHASLFIRPLQRNLNLDPVSSSLFNWCSILKMQTVNDSHIVIVTSTVIAFVEF